MKSSENIKFVLMKLPALLIAFLFMLPSLLHSQWQPLESPPGTDPLGLVESDGRIFARTTSGLYFSDDQGDSWTNSFSGGLERGFTSFVQAAGQTVICRIQPVQGGDYQILISNNNGDSWSLLPLPEGTNYRSLAFNGEVIIYRSIPLSIYLSYDLGESWTLLDNAEWPFSPGQLFTAGGVFFCRGVQGGFWRSDPLAANWENLPLDVGPNDYIRVYNENGLLLAGTEQGAIHYSLDDGQTWNTSASFSDFSSSGDGFWARGDSLYTIHNGSVYVSNDQGATWAGISALSLRFRDLLLLDGQNLFAKTTGIYQSQGLSQPPVPSMSGIQGLGVDDYTLVGNRLFYYNSTDRSIKSATIDAGGIQMDNTVFSDFTLDEMIGVNDDLFVNESVISGLSNVRHRITRVSSDGEQNVIHESNNGPWLASDHLKYADDKLFYFNSGSAWIYSTDRGESWQNGSALNPISCYDYERHEDAVFSIVPNGVMRRRDGEANWSLVNNGLDFETFPLSNGVLDTRLVSTEGALFLLLGRGDNDFIEFYVSHDGGDSWQATATDLPDIILPYLNAPQGVKNIVAIGGYHIMALRDVGIAISADQGLNWAIYNDGLPTDEVNQIEVHDGRIVAATRRYGFWELYPANIRLRQVNGRVFFDENTNGQLDAGEIPVSNVKLLLENTEDIAFSNQEGEYRLSFIGEGIFGPALENPYLVAVPASRQTADSGPLDFALQLNEEGPDISVSVFTDQVHRPGFPIRYYLQYQNLSGPVNSASLRLDFYPELNYDGASQAPAQVDGSSIRFELGALPLLASGTIAVDFTLDPLTPLGSQASSTLTAMLPDGDVDLANNEAVLEDIVVGSYDPNDIQVSHKVLSPAEVMNEQVLRYRIRFQNTGTYPAERVVVRNALPEELNLSSIARIASSHPMVIQREGRQELAFVFDGIQLPDSTSNEAASHGFIEYDIRVQRGLIPGDSIRNQAAIYFDFNPPIITNIALTVVAPLNNIGSLSDGYEPVWLAPNPVAAGAPVRLLAPGQSGVLCLFDQSGRLLRKVEPFVCDTDSLATQGLPPGAYWAVLFTEGGGVAAKMAVHAP